MEPHGARETHTPSPQEKAAFGRSSHPLSLSTRNSSRKCFNKSHHQHCGCVKHLNRAEQSISLVKKCLNLVTKLKKNPHLSLTNLALFSRQLWLKDLAATVNCDTELIIHRSNESCNEKDTSRIRINWANLPKSEIPYLFN